MTAEYRVTEADAGQSHVQRYRQPSAAQKSLRVCLETLTDVLCRTTGRVRILWQACEVGRQSRPLSSVVNFAVASLPPPPSSYTICLPPFRIAPQNFELTVYNTTPVGLPFSTLLRTPALKSHTNLFNPAITSPALFFEAAACPLSIHVLLPIALHTIPFGLPSKALNLR